MTSHRRIIAFIAAIPLIFVGSRVTLPGVSAAQLQSFTGGSRGGLLGLYELVFQGGLHRGAVLALGIMPYLSARIFFRLWRAVRPDSHATKTKTRLLTVALSIIQSAGLAGALLRMPGVVANPGPGFVATTVLTLTAGSLLAMWFGEQLTEVDDPEDPDSTDEAPALRGQIPSGNFAHAAETPVATPPRDRVQSRKP